MRVLLADDSAVMRKIIIRALNAVGVNDIVEVGDGDAAMETFGSGGFDAVLTDWNMPGKNGLEVIKGIRETDKDVPIFMITTEAEKRRVLEAIQAGVTDYLAKPFESDVLKEKLQKHVGLPA